MNDIVPPRRPLQGKPGISDKPKVTMPPNPSTTGVAAQAETRQPQRKLISAPLAEPLLEAKNPSPKKPRRRGRIALWIVGSLLIILGGVAALSYIWYTDSLKPVNSVDQSRQRVTIEQGSSPLDIASLLVSKGLIKNKESFDIYTRLSQTRSKLQAGTYSLSPSESLETIVAHLVAGRVDQFTLTFLPGATLAENKKVFTAAGYGAADVDAALNKTYDHPLFADKPSGTDLEGYIYGETYNFDSSASVEAILKKTFDYYYQVITTNNLKAGFEAQGLNLYEGITLASIIQREVPSAADQKKVAQVFFSRLRIGMTLGSDVTYQYAAKKMGVAPTPELDSPYNTRKVTGLPPGPIATPGKSALQAVASPSEGDYLFFLSGDDEVTYFARTSEEHEANIRDHCQKKCAIL